jgi:hypothetical protein
LYGVVDGLLTEYVPKELYIIAIDNWFDHKWLRFSGIGVVPFEFPAFMNAVDSALHEFRQDKVTFPAFSPSRVIGQSYFAKDGRTTAYVKQGRHAEPYKKRRQPSGNNLHRRIQDISDSGLFVWYSSNTIANDRASMMVYAVRNAQVVTWFAAFRKTDRWKVHATKGIDREFIQQIIS